MNNEQLAINNMSRDGNNNFNSGISKKPLSLTQNIIHCSLLFVNLMSIGSVAQPACDVTLDQLDPADFTASLVLNGESNRTSGGNPVEPYENIAKPTQLGFMPGNSRYVFFNEIYRGTIRKWDTQTKTLTTLLDLDLNTTGERGLTGFVFHPDFAINNWVFMVYNDHNNLFKLARYEYDLDKDILINEKILIEHPIKTQVHHYGNGQITITDNGVLFVPLGSDAHFAGDALFGDDLGRNGEATAGNTNTISSSILRIIPDSSAEGYRIPAGNFGEYFENYFRELGNTSLADEYSEKVKPEIFAKGIRTDFTVATHPKKDWLAWGEVNTANSTDEYNVISTPMFSGYPYFHGDNHSFGGSNPNKNADPSEPIPNNSPYNTGVSLLPPVQTPTLPPINIGRKTSATAADIYNFDSHQGEGRFPKAFDSHLLMFDFEWTEQHMFVSLLSENGDMIDAGEQVDVSRLLGNVFMRHTLDAEFSPAGELYILNNGDNTYGNCGNQCGSIDKVVYSGDQCPQTVAVAGQPYQNLLVQKGNILLNRSHMHLVVNIRNMAGRTVRTARLEPGAGLDTGGHQRTGLTPGIWILSVSGRDVNYTKKILINK